MTATTKNEMFNKWKSTGPDISWTTYWFKIWTDELKRDIETRGWTLLPIEKQNKRPIQKGWPERRLTLDDALNHVKLNHNIAVNFGKSNIMAVDCDTELTEKYIMLTDITLTMRTPRGYQFILSSDENTLPSIPPIFDTLRRDNMYSLIPYSETCTKSKDYCIHNDKHDYKIRTWLDPNIEPMPINEFIEILNAI